jgi:hypothetical protein
MLNHLSWTSYFEGIISLLVIYYVGIAIRYYRQDIKGLLGAETKTTPGLPDQLLYQQASVPANKASGHRHLTDDNDPAHDISEADELIAQIKRHIAAAPAPAELIPQIKNIFQTYTAFKTSPHRAAINELVVSECEKTGAAGLSEDEVDQWWED